MRALRSIGTFGACIVMLLLALPAAAQLTTGSVGGTVKDPQGAVVPGATVTLVSETRGTRSIPVTTDTNGDFVFPNLTADTYTIEVELTSFKTLRQSGIAVNPGPRVAVGVLTIEVGGTAETVTVKSEAPQIQTASGERSFTIPTETVQNLPMANRSFLQLAQLAPGVVMNGVQAQRLGSIVQSTTVMMDGVSTMDTGSNGAIVQMNVESIAEVKVLVQGYQAEYGRSSGLQITAVSKSGTNRFRGSFYNVRRNSDWNENNKANILNGTPKPILKQQEIGYSIGGPIGKPGGNNKLFFFHALEFLPRTGGNDAVSFRMPTELERRGDFSQTLDNLGNPYPYIKDPNINGVCTGGGPDRVLQGWWRARPDPGGSAVSARAEHPEDVADAELPGHDDRAQLRDHQAGRKDSRLPARGPPRLSAIPVAAGQREVPGRHPAAAGVQRHDSRMERLENGAPAHRDRSRHGQLQHQPDDVPRGHLRPGREPAGGVRPDAELLQPDGGAGQRYFEPEQRRAVGTAAAVSGGVGAQQGLLRVRHPHRGQRAVLRRHSDSAGAEFLMGQPVVASANNQGAPPNINFPGFLNINTTQDVVISLTKVKGSHTFKTGFYNSHSLKRENNVQGAADNFGTLSFANDTVGTNPFDTSFGFANAAIGSFSSYAQASRYVEGTFKYNNVEGYVQDNWKVNNQLTLDYGVRFVHAQPQYDSLLQSGNFLPDKWSQVGRADSLRRRLRQRRVSVHGHQPSGDESRAPASSSVRIRRWRSARWCRTPAT